jgi:hypothetical protein
MVGIAPAEELALFPQSFVETWKAHQAHLSLGHVHEAVHNLVTGERFHPNNLNTEQK